MSAMESILSVASLRDEIKQQTIAEIEKLGRAPRLALLRCVSDPGSLFMEKQIRAACRDTGVECWFMELPSYLAEDVLVKAVHQIGQDVSVDAVGLLCPPQYDKSLLGSAIGEQKDINGYCRTSSSRFLPTFDSAVFRILDHFQIECSGKKILFLHYSKSVHYILRRILGIRGGEIAVREDSTPEPDFDPELLITAGPLEEIPSSLLTSVTHVVSVAVGSYGEPLFNDDSGIRDPGSVRILPVPGGVDDVIPYIYTFNTAIAAK